MAKDHSNWIEGLLITLLVSMPYLIVGNVSFLQILMLMGYFPFIFSQVQLMAIVSLMIVFLVISCSYMLREWLFFKRQFSSSVQQYPRFLQNIIAIAWRGKQYRSTLVMIAIGNVFLVVLAIGIVLLDAELNATLFFNGLIFFDKMSELKVQKVAFPFVLAVALLLSSAVYMFSVFDKFQRQVIMYWHHAHKLRAFSSLLVIMSVLGSVVIASSMIPSSLDVFILTLLQFFPFFLIFLTLFGIIILVVAFIGIFFGWVPFFLYLVDGSLLPALLVGVVYLYLMLGLFNYHGQLLLLARFNDSSLKSSLGETTVQSLKSAEKELKKRELDILLATSIERGWASWKSRPWMKLTTSDVRRRILERYELERDHFVVLNNVLLYMPAIASQGVMDIDKMASTLQVNVNALKSVMRRHWGADALFLTPTLVIHRQQLMLAESFSLDELESLNVDEINIQALKTTILSLDYYGFADKADALRKTEMKRLKRDATNVAPIDGSKKHQQLELASNLRSATENVLDDESRILEALTVAARMGDANRIHFALSRITQDQDQILKAGEILLAEGRILDAFEWFCQHQYWNWALDAGAILIREDIQRFSEHHSKGQLISTIRAIFEAYLNSGIVNHGVLLDVALIVLYLQLHEKLQQEDIEKEELASCLEDVAVISPHLFPPEVLLEEIWRLFSEAGNRAKAITILQQLANKSEGVMKQRYYDLIEEEMKKESGTYQCVLDQKQHDMASVQRVVCRRCKKSTCINCVRKLKNSEDSPETVNCGHCGTALVGKEKESADDPSAQIYCIPLEPEHLVALVSEYLSQNP